MALSGSEIDAVELLAEVCKAFMQEYGNVVVANILFNGASDYKTTITQPEIAVVPELNDVGITATNIQDAAFAIGGIKAAIDAALPTLSLLANMSSSLGA